MASTFKQPEELAPSRASALNFQPRLESHGPISVGAAATLDKLFHL